MRMRIYQASKNNEEDKLWELQKLLLQSNSNILQSIRRITIINQGRKTAGLDKITTLSPTERWKIFLELKGVNCSTWNGTPVRRVYIPKANGKLRPLEIPTLNERIVQAMVKNTLEPE